MARIVFVIYQRENSRARCLRSVIVFVCDCFRRLVTVWCCLWLSVGNHGGLVVCSCAEVYSGYKP